ncbi:PREDICTED: putative phytosulfokines 6 [Nelumbo nucifera]|uniref:Phytosulfokine n=2 Tax=Nelumbo nucifera TaxID=4432 RepID=A0A822YGW8_NELNU|nr:PREDICTED: putative phytosulfokines 6 [Nelumbo nucifera]DAD28718.1 TPA_asm: hypothetical protein HUJ06_030186 [Nelumbo nucifera]
MKQSFRSPGLLLFLLFLLLSYSTTSARLMMQPKQGDKAAKGHEIVNPDPILKTAEEDTWNLLGLEKCENLDEECLKRRMISEAHLDYIYTQHHRP